MGKYADEDSKNLLLASAAAVAAATKDLLDVSVAAVATADPGTRKVQAEGATKIDFGSSKLNATAEAIAPGASISFFFERGGKRGGNLISSIIIRVCALLCSCVVAMQWLWTPPARSS